MSLKVLNRRDDLKARFHAFRPRGQSEANDLEQMLTLLRGSEDPFDRDHFCPGHFTASGFVLHPESESLLLIHHRKLDLWLQPGGHVEPADSSILEGAKRELTEEAGLRDLQSPASVNSIFDLDIHLIPALGSDPSHRHFDVRFLFLAASRQISPGSEVRGARWVKLSGLSELATDASVTRAADKIHALGVSSF